MFNFDSSVPLWRKPLQEESARGLLLRLVALNKYPSIEAVARGFGTTAAAVARGEDAALGSLADAMWCDQDLLAKDSIRIVSSSGTAKSAFAIRNEEVSQDFVSLSVRRMCPQCVEESAHHRFWWDVTPIASCPRHHLRLVNSCECGQRFTWHDRDLLQSDRCEHSHPTRLLRTPVTAGDLIAENYILSRLKAAEPLLIPILDEMSLFDACDTMERIGAASEGYFEDWQTAAALGTSREILRNRGCEIILEGKLAEVFDRIWSEYKKRDSKRQDGFTTGYGWLYKWLSYKGGSKFAPLLSRELLNHGAARFTVSKLSGLGDIPTGPGTKVALKEAAAICKVTVDTMRSIGVALGLVRKEKRSGVYVTFDYEDVLRIAGDLADTVNLQVASKRLGIGHGTFHQLIDHRLVTPVFHGGSKTKFEYVFKAEAVDRLLTNLAAGALTVTEPSTGSVSLVRARGAYGITTADICKLVLDGRLPVREQVRGVVGLPSLFVRMDEIANSLINSQRDDFWPIPRAGKVAGLSPKGVNRAIDAGLLRSTKQGPRILVSRADSEQFRLDFMMLAEVMRHIAGTSFQVKVWLARDGITPDAKVAGCGHVAFDRERALAWIEAMKKRKIRKVFKTDRSDIAADAIVAILKRSRAPQSGPMLTQKLLDQHCDLGRYDPKTFVRKVMWRRRHLFVYVQGQGYCLKEALKAT